MDPRLIEARQSVLLTTIASTFVIANEVLALAMRLRQSCVSSPTSLLHRIDSFVISLRSFNQIVDRIRLAIAEYPDRSDDLYLTFGTSFSLIHSDLDFLRIPFQTITGPNTSRGKIVLSTFSTKYGPWIRYASVRIDQVVARVASYLSDPGHAPQGSQTGSDDIQPVEPDPPQALRPPDIPQGVLFWHTFKIENSKVLQLHNGSTRLPRSILPMIQELVGRRVSTSGDQSSEAMKIAVIAISAEEGSIGRHWETCIEAVNSFLSFSLAKLVDTGLRERFTHFSMLSEPQPNSNLPRVGFLHTIEMNTVANSNKSMMTAMSWDPRTNVAVVCISGLQLTEGEPENNLQRVLNTLTISESAVSHPFFVLWALLDVILQQDFKALEGHVSRLQFIEALTSISPLGDALNDINIENNEPVNGEAELQQDANAEEDKFDTVIKELNSVTSSLSFHRMRVEATHDALQKMKQSLGKIGDTQLDINDSIKRHLASLDENADTLLRALKLYQETARSQLQIVYTMLSQRDTRETISLAQASVDIAAAAKADSSSLRIIALISTLFLPGTFVCALFSMTMFNWRPGPNEPIVSPHFWIYWTVTVLLTIAVFVVVYFFILVGTPDGATRPEIAETRYQSLRRRRMETQRRMAAGPQREGVVVDRLGGIQRRRNGRRGEGQEEARIEEGRNNGQADNGVEGVGTA